MKISVLVSRPVRVTPVEVLLLSILLVVVIWPISAKAQMHVTVEADRVSLGDQGEFVPRFATFFPNVLVVPAGKTVTLPASSTFDAIEVAGTLRVSRSYDTSVRFVHLLVLPGGRLDVGTAEDPVLRRVEFIIRDVPIDTKRDPFQWGNGIVNFGAQTRVGRQLARTWTELTEDAPAGATMLTLAEVPGGWQVGDEIFLPDMRQMTKDAPPRLDPSPRIIGISGKVVRLSRALEFARTSVLDPEGNVVLRPRVANVTRSIVIRSENPAGTRGHTANVGHMASWDIRYNQFVGVGRTQFTDLNNTTLDLSQIGTNQIGRYANHDHHGGSSLDVRQNIGNAYLGTYGSKWAHAVHGTHDTLVEENVCIEFQGGCYASEDGYEVRNTFRRNVAAYSVGNGRGANKRSPGGEGSGFWFRGLYQFIEGNESWNNVTGINLFNRDHVARTTPVPSARGGAADTTLNLVAAVPMSFQGNVTLGNTATGLEYWSVRRFAAEDHVSAHNHRKQFWAVNSGNTHVYFRNVTLLASGGTSTCAATSEAYTFTLEIDGGSLKGCDVGIERGGARHGVTLRNVTFQNRVNIVFVPTPPRAVLENVVHKPLASLPKRYIVFGNGSVWTPTSSASVPPEDRTNHWGPYKGAQHIVKNWQDTGQDFNLFEHQQLASTAAWPAINGKRRGYVPQLGLTMGQAWKTYGMAYGGDVLEDAEAVTLEGVENGFGRPAAEPRLGVPKAVMTFPNTLSPAPVQVRSDGKRLVRLYFSNTGDDRIANAYAVISVDGSAPVRVSRSRGGEEHSRRADTTAASVGTHTVVTWREDLNGQKIPGSEMKFQYVVSDDPGTTEQLVD
jgi:hypothetical protein